MSQSKYFQEFRRAVSGSRLAPYLNQVADGDEAQAFGAYLWNLALCESLYPSLHGIEVALRNSIHGAASQKFGTEFWFHYQLTGHEKEQIEKLDQDFKALGVSVEPGRYIAECTFGFWVNLMNGKYEQSLWRPLIQPVFSHAPKHQRIRRRIRVRLDGIRRLRNRVFHHEPIWHWPDLPEHHRQILETIGWSLPGCWTGSLSYILAA